VLEVIHVFRARVVDFALDSLTIEITGGEEKVDRLLEVLRPYGILEMVRTGVVAMRRGTKLEEEAAAAAAASGNGAATLASDDNVSYSV
jgi:acetolactate synthase-1/3 small subunit